MELFQVVQVVLGMVLLAVFVRRQLAGKLNLKPASPQPAVELCPDPTPLTELTLEKLETYDDRPWRPFRWPYHQTMSIFKLDINHWLDMDKWYKRYITEHVRVIRETGSDYCDCLPQGEEASEELLQVVVNHLTKRYPNLFKRTEIGVDNLITGESMDLSKPYKEHPLHYIARLAKEDFYLVQRNPDDGKHYLVAAVVPAPGGFFSVKDKIGQHIDTIHTEVPYYEEKLKVSMERWFARMKPNDPVERASWFVCWDHELRCNGIFNQSSDGGGVVPESTEFEKYNVRVCRQTLRRLPKTNAIIFSNHPIFYSIDEMKDEPMIPSILKKVILDGPEKILKYKAFEKFDQHLMPYLDSLIQRQIDLGIITKDQPIKTRPSYPFADWYDVSEKHSGNGYPNPASTSIS
ncbi:hypothetical protein V1514DRAFT_327964 [Lipomyces japonicus]|uniref:uncharacterized protein n=1 Tax=Lipomyces japonicus TaxID=56871 RepID=UPI0034CDDBBF